MYTMLVCRQFGYAIEMLPSHGHALTRFNAVINDDDVTAAVFYGPKGEQINAYANPREFKS